MTNETFQITSQILVALGIFLTGLGGFGAYYYGKRIEQEKGVAQAKKEEKSEAQRAYAGRLKSQVLLSPGGNVYPKFEFGDSGAILMFTGPQGSPLFKLAADNDLTILVENGQLMVSTVIRDKGGRVVAEITKNEWKVNPQNSWDRNYSSEALEVKDPSGDIVLQIKVVEDRVQFQAKMYDATGRGVGFGKVLGPNG